jgi:2'-5' RNA ligase
VHRLFLGCPIEPGPAATISAWAANDLTGTRPVPPKNLHVTLLFFGSVDEAARDRLMELTKQTAWNPLTARTGELGAFGKSALALRIGILEEDSELLEDRLARTCQWIPPGLTADEEAEWNRQTWPSDDPLYQMALLVPIPEIIRKQRRQRQRRPLELHLTVARTKARSAFHLSEKCLPPLELLLDRLVLFESHLGPGGSRYERLAEATRT